MDDELRQIGERIRLWRVASRLTLQQLSDRCNVAASTIHKIENLQTTPTITVLARIAKGLGRRTSELLDDFEPAEPLVVLRQSDRVRVPFGDQGDLELLISTFPMGRLNLWRVRLEPGVGVGMPGSEPWSYMGELALLVEEGSVQVSIRGDSFDLASGDSMHFDASLPHRWFATGDVPAKLVVTAIVPEAIRTALGKRIVEVTSDEKRSVRCLNTKAPALRT